MRILITGASGALGGYLLRHLAGTGVTITAWSGSRGGALFGIPLRPVNLADPDAVAPAYRDARPDAVIHAAAIASLAECHRDPEQAHRVNVAGTAQLAELAAAAGARLLLVSTDLVFDGERGNYAEGDAPSPLSIYARTKLEAEHAALARKGSLVARVSLLFGPTLTRRGSFFDQMLASLHAGRPVTCFADEWRTPLGLAPAAAALATLARSDFEGLLHVGGPERLSRLEMGQRLAKYLGVDPALIVATSRADAAGPEPRPRDTSLVSSKWRSLFPHEPWPACEGALTFSARCQ
jgi:dTDP-4-dehydrorhamnose reductase